MLSRLIFFVLCASCAGLQAQSTNAGALPPNDSLRLVVRLPVKARFATNDHLGNFYIITTDNALEKYAASGKFLTRYSGNRHGQATWMDVSNPFKVLVWYADFREVVFLDRSLTWLGSLNLIQAGYPEVRTVAAAQDGSIWAYNEVAFKLLKISAEGERRFESLDLNQLEYTPAHPSRLREDNNFLYMADSVAGIGIFDAFAQFYRAYRPQMPVYDFQMQAGGMYLLSDSAIVFQQGALSLPRQIPLPKTARALPKNLGIRHLFVKKEDELEVWGF